MCSQAFYVTRIDEIDRAAKIRVRDALVMRQVKPVGFQRLFDATLEARPAGESVLPGDRELGVAQAELNHEDLIVAGAAKLRMKLTQQLGRRECMCCVRFNQVFGLIFEVTEVGIGWELSYRHGELPFVCPGPQV